MDLVLSVCGLYLNLRRYLVQTSNSLGQSPCTVIAYMMSTCNGGREFFFFFFLFFFNCRTLVVLISLSFAEYLLWPLQPTWVYFGPSGTDNANLCECSTVGYSLFSACGACQEQEWITCDHIMFAFFNPSTSDLSVIRWSQWVTNCTKTMPPSS